MRKQRIGYTAAGLTGLLLVLALVVMANWLGARHWKRADWTSSHLYTLSEKTLGVLESLPDEVRVVVFMTPQSPLYDQVHELLERYASASDKIHVEYIDPDREPLKTRQLAQQFGISAANTVVFSSGERSKYVTSDQMAEYDYSGMQMGQAPTLKGFRGEEQFTAAILSVVSPSVPKIYFVTGHGEASPEGGDSHRSLASLVEAIKRENMTTAKLSLFGGTIPDDAAAVAIIGPSEPYTEAEVKLLGDYLTKGGRLLVCLDPLINRDGTMKQTRLEPLLARYGVTMGDDLVVDPSRTIPGFDLSVLYLDSFGHSPVTKGLEGVAVLLPVTRSMTLGTVDGFTDTALVKTTAEGWGETDLGKLAAGKPVAKDDKDLAGPVTVAAAAEPSAAPDDAGAKPAEDAKAQPADGKGPRLVVIGDSDFLTDDWISNAGNLTLALNSVSWLAHREQALGIAPRAVEQVNLFLTGQQMLTIFLITLVGMPVAAIILGVVVWRRRRH